MPKILLCEDDPDQRELLVFFLIRSGYDVIEAANGEEGLRKALADPPDLAIIDWMMPKMDGKKLCAALRADPRTARVRLILCTAAVESGQQPSSASNVDAYLAKPWDWSAVERLLKRSLAHPS